MKESLLASIGQTVGAYADVIANVIKVDVEIVDNNLYRIAGTGIYQGMAGVKAEGVIYQEVLNTGKEYIIENPREHRLCQKCTTKNNCLEKMEISVPVFSGEKIIGVIGLICSTESQKEYLSKNLKSYMDFLYKIADLISAKVFESQTTQRNLMLVNLLSQIMNNVENGVLVTNSEGKIVQINDSALKQLKLNQAVLNKKIEITRSNEFIMDGESITIKIADKKFYLIGSLFPAGPLLKDYSQILIFKRMKELKSAVYKLTEDIRPPVSLDSIIGKSQVMQILKDKIRKISDTKSTVLITGESGTGKELVARAIHNESPRRQMPFVAINCAAIPDTLLESELFGYVKGAFSGASSSGRIGKFELANKGTIFLDEIGDMPLYLQSKLLRVLQERTLARIGSNQLIELDIRVIAATNKHLKKLVGENKFREDLYYRINVIPIEIPPLRERKEDLELILAKLIDKYNRRFARAVLSLSEKAREALYNYHWPGNIRELENTAELMVSMAEGCQVVDVDILPVNILSASTNDKSGPVTEYEKAAGEIRPLKEIENEYILKALDKYGYDTSGKKAAADKLGIGLATLYRKIGNHQGE